MNKTRTYEKGELSFDDLPNAVEKLNVKIDELIGWIKLFKPEKQKNKLLNVQEAANFLNLVKSTVYSKVCKGELPHMKKGKRLYFSEEELMTYIKSGKVKTTTDFENDADDFLSNRKRS